MLRAGNALIFETRVRIDVVNKSTVNVTNPIERKFRHMLKKKTLIQLPSLQRCGKVAHRQFEIDNVYPSEAMCAY